jgi:carbon starvation protein
METLLIALASGLAFIVAYRTYGRWLGQKIFRLSAEAVCPSHRLNDGVDYVPTTTSVVFGHHFASIAGTGPIVGPAIAIMWGWLPALLWVVFGSIFIGAVHDFGSLVVSLRNNGQTVGEIAGRVINRRVRLLFLLVLFMALTIVLAIFGLVIASVFRQFPSAIAPCVIQVPIAIAVGLWLRRRGISLLVPSVIALMAMYLTVIYGDVGVLHAFNQTLASWTSWQWVLVLLAYSYIASVLPVWTLLQPRDYINALQLISVLGLLLLGLVVAGVMGGAPLADGVRPALEMAAPVVNWSPVGAPIIFPFLFITVACGAISGFHCLVSSGTSSKQLSTEPAARAVGYGGMLTEGFLAVLVIIACAAGLGLGLAQADGTTLVGAEAWASRYGVWSTRLGPLVAAFVDGSANLLKAVGVPGGVAVALMGVFVASFAGTTLDSACRLQRYVIQELASTFRPAGSATGADPLRWLRGKHGAAIAAVSVAALVAAAPPPGKEWALANAGQGGLILWPLFGATNQLLGGLSFLVIAFYLWRRRIPVWFMVIPMVFMLIMPLWAMLWQVFIGGEGNPSWWGQGNWLLVGVALATLALEAWMIVEAVRLFPRVRGLLETAPPEEAVSLEAPAIR